MEVLEIKKKNHDCRFPIDLDAPYLFISHLEFNDINNKKLQFIGIEVTLKYTKGKKTVFNNLLTNVEGNKVIINKELEIENNLEYVNIKVNDIDEEKDWNALIYFIVENIKDDEFASSEFTTHLEKTNTSKIFFSAPYGQGKSTFLKDYFNSRTSDYEVFTLFPVNYVISNNEDIFRYIKTDILFQLFSKKITLTDERIENYLAAYKYLVSSPQRVLSSLLKIALTISFPGMNLADIVSEIDSTLNKIKETQTEPNKRELIEKYLEVVYDKEGSIYEDDFYSQLIRESVEQLKESSNKKTVLIIEDLDRIDPEHIFRILNVISAHYDSYSLSDDSYHNKFGFDKIIIVGHIENIKRIYKHRYGEKTEFKGYISKFYSSTIFKFQYKNAINELIEEYILKAFPKELKHIHLILSFLMRANILTLRDFIKLKHRIVNWDSYEKNRQKILSNIEEKSTYFKNGLFTVILYELREIYGNPKELNDKIHEIKQDEIDLKDWDWQRYYLGAYLLTSLATKENQIESSKHSVSIQKEEFKFTIKRAAVHPYTFYNTDLVEYNSKHINDFTVEQIKNLIIENLNRL